MKRLRKFLTLMLALCMVLAMSVTVMAADEDGVTSTFTFTNQGEQEVDKEDLEKEVDQASELNEGDYTSESWETLEDALDRAKDVLNDPNATQEDVDQALKDLEDAIADLVSTSEVDKTELEEETKEAESLNENDYTPESWEALEEALAQAEEVLNDPDATQEEINQALKDLEDAIAALAIVTTPEVDKTELEEEYKEAKSLNESDYTPESWDALEKALAQAEKALADPDATQDEVDQARQALIDAMNALVETGTGTPGDTGTPSAKTGDVNVSVYVVTLMIAAACIALILWRRRVGKEDVDQ